MQTATLNPTRRIIFAVDWAKDSRKRAAYVADLSSRLVRKIFPNTPLTLKALLDLAASLPATDSVILAFDVPLGVPQSFLKALAAIPSWRCPSNFLDLLTRARESSSFYVGTAHASHWTPERPFFSVPAGAGGLKSYIEAAAKHSVDLWRNIERRPKANSVFMQSGIPGLPGGAACSLWQEIAPLLGPNRTFRIWPFEGELELLRMSGQIVLAEMYPRLAYATVLLNSEPASRPTLLVAKTKSDARRAAIEGLRAAEWVRHHGVTIENSAEAETSEDDFDALMTAAALLRCELEGMPLHSQHIGARAAEGGILGTGSINLDLPARTFILRSQPAGITKSAVIAAASFRCPIPGCQKLFAKTRGGWDSHVASLRTHPSWQPTLHSAEQRKKQFVSEFPNFFC